MSAIPDSTWEILRRSPFRIVPEPFIYVRAGRVGSPERHLLVVRDELETTVVTHEANLADVEVLARNPDRWRLIAIDCANPFYCVGFLAAISETLCAAGLDILAVSTFTRDYVLVKDEAVDAAAAALVRMGMPAAP